MEDKMFKVYSEYAPTEIFAIKLGFSDEYLDECYNTALNLDHTNTNKTSVTGKMSSWNIWDQTDIYNPILDRVIKEMKNIISLEEYNRTKLVILNSWVTVMNKGDKVREHAHNPCYFSFTYCINSNENDSPLVFNCLKNREIKQQKDYLLLFPSHLKHSVQPLEENSNRVILAGNITSNIHN